MRILVALMLMVSSLRAATITAASGSSADVATALALASSGDTVQIPAGTNSWTSQVLWAAPANVTLQGAGMDHTRIIDNYGSQQTLFSINATAGGLRITGINFHTTTNELNYKYVLSVSGGPIRIDNCRFAFSNLNYRIGLFNGAFGVMDHNHFAFKGGGSCIFITNGRLGINDSAGNLEWTLPTDFGGANYIYIEDNGFRGSPTTNAYDARVFDCYTAGKVVVRFNSLTNVNGGEPHATGHAGDDRGPRSIEIYGNKCYFPTFTAGLDADGMAPGFAFSGLYSGTALFWGNEYDQCFKNGFRLQVVRSAGQSAGGTYNQSIPPNGWGYAGTNFNGVASAWDGNVEAGTGYPALDQPGRGMGALLSNAFPSKVNFVTGTIAWPTQALEPVYLWDNAGSIVNGWGGADISDGSGGRVVANRDYYPQASGVQTSPTSPFDGTSGTGWGTLANRPTTCTAGVAYWATDQGSWNTSTTNTYGVQMNGADGVLYKATAENTWTLYYTPYTYPHPLATNSSSGSSPPKRLNAIRANVGRIRSP